MDEDLKPLKEFDVEGLDEAAKNIVGDAPRIGWGEILLITPLLLFVDFTELMVGFIEAVPVAGQVVLVPLSIVFSAVSVVITISIQFYLFIKKIKNLTFFLTSLADSVPLVSALPLRTAGWLVTVIVTNSKKLSRVINQTPAGKVAGVLNKL